LSDVNPFELRSKSRPLLLGAFAVVLMLCCAGLPHAGESVEPLRAVPQVAWTDLSDSQRHVLAPLAGQWASLSETSRQKWLQLGIRLQTLPAAERQRIQQRMVEWARLPASERAHARMQFLEAQSVSPTARQSQWESFQALPEETKLALAQRAKVAAAAPPPIRLRPSVVNPPSTLANAGPKPTAKPGAEPVSPTLKKAQLGATTTLASKLPEPPAHQKAGMPKIAGSPDYVHQATLLPRPEVLAAPRAPAKTDGTAPRLGASAPALPAPPATPTAPVAASAPARIVSP